jgi:NhaA family Na+:H+ antiporter
MAREKRVLFAVVAPFQAFFRLEAAGGIAVMIGATLALVWANSPFRNVYEAIFHSTIELKLAGYGIDWTVHHFTNDALMTLFFAVAGLEIKRELTHGELRTWNRVALPLAAAFGGMVVPAAIYLSLNPSGPERAGWGVPMATDIAFALGCLTLIKRRVPPALFVFLTALAIFDDLGAIVAIALFYGHGVDPTSLALAIALTVALFLLGRSRVSKLWPYALLGGLLWIALLRSGVHATLAGVVVGLALPATPRRAPREVLDDLDVAVASLRRETDRRGAAPEGTIAAIERHVESVQSPLDRTMHGLHGLVAFFIVPLFALANAGITLTASAFQPSSLTLGAALGLVLGKPLGIAGTTFIAVRSGLAPKPTQATWLQVLAVSCIAGIGFTMSLLVGNLAFAGARSLEDQAKLGVVTASLVSALLGLALLRFFSPTRQPTTDHEDVPVYLDVPRFAQGYGVRPIGVIGPLRGQTLADLDVRRRFGVTVIGRWKASPAQGTQGARKLEPVAPDEQLLDGDLLLVAGADEAIESLVRFVGVTSDRPLSLQDQSGRS